MRITVAGERKPRPFQGAAFIGLANIFEYLMRRRWDRNGDGAKEYNLRGQWVPFFSADMVFWRMRFGPVVMSMVIFSVPVTAMFMGMSVSTVVPVVIIAAVVTAMVATMITFMVATMILLVMVAAVVPIFFVVSAVAVTVMTIPMFAVGQSRSTQKCEQHSQHHTCFERFSDHVEFLSSFGFLAYLSFAYGFDWMDASPFGKVYKES